MRYKVLTACAISIYMLSACSSKPVSVVIDQAKADSISRKIVVDGKTMLNLKGDTTVALQLEPGKHYLQINDSAKKEFTVPPTGGIVNLDNSEYVVYEIMYAAQERQPDAANLPKNISPVFFGAPSAVLIDSFIITPKTFRALADSTLAAMVPSLIKAKNNPKPIHEHKLSQALTLTGRGQFFIEKFWDYSMTDSIPKTMMLKTNDIGGRIKTSIARSNIFLLSLLFSEQDEYIVKSLKEIREGKEDKEKMKEQESKQMEF